MNDGSGDGTNSFEVKIRTKTAKFTNMIIARFRESRYLVRGLRNPWRLKPVHTAYVLLTCPVQFGRKLVLGTRRNWLKPRRDRDVCLPRPRRWQLFSRRDRDETLVCLETETSRPRPQPCWMTTLSASLRGQHFTDIICDDVRSKMPVSFDHMFCLYVIWWLTADVFLCLL